MDRRLPEIAQQLLLIERELRVRYGAEYTVLARSDYAAAETLRAQLEDIAGITVLDQGRERSGLVSFNMAGRDAVSVQRALAGRGVTIGSNGVPYTPLDMQARGLTQIARASVSYLTSGEEIDRLLEALRSI